MTLALLLLLADPAPRYPDHADPAYLLDAAGKRQAIKTIDDWKVRRDHILLGMQEVMGPLPGKAKRVPLDVKAGDEKMVGSIIRRKISFQSEAGCRVPAYLLLPAQREGKLPAVLCLQQTTKIGKDEPAGLGGSANMHYALELAQRGYVTLAPDFPSFGEYVWDFAPKHGYVSGTMKAIWDNQRAIDLLQSLPEVDGERIGCIGHSLGGHMAMFTAAFEPRIKAIVSSCGFTRFGRDDMPSWTGPRYMPRIASQHQNDVAKMPFDFPEVIALFAPRPFLAVAATMDSDFDVKGVKESLTAAEPIYRIYGKAELLKGIYPESKHDFPEAARKKAYEFLDQHLGRVK